MPRRGDATNVPQTCPFINEVISFIDRIEWNEDQESSKEEAKLILLTLETIRTHNGSLRDFGNEQYYQAYELESENDSLKSEVKRLEDDVKYLESEISKIESTLM